MLNLLRNDVCVLLLLCIIIFMESLIEREYIFVKGQTSKYYEISKCFNIYIYMLH